MISTRLIRALNGRSYLHSIAVVSSGSSGIRYASNRNTNFNQLFSPKKSLVRSVETTEKHRCQRISSSSIINLHDSIQLKKRPRRFRREDEISKLEKGYLTVTAFATAGEYDLERLLAALKDQNLYEPKQFLSSGDNDTDPDVLHVTAKYKVGNESRDLYFFREGTVVLWNCTDLENSNILRFLKQFEQVREAVFSEL